MLSNTAVPRYYGAFRERVLDGEIPVCREVEMEMNRQDRLIRDQRFYYDDEAINGFVAFCEAELTLTDGSPLKLMDTFKLWAESLLSWFYFVERSVFVPDPDGYGGHFETRKIRKRLVNKQYLIVGRGGAKSMYAACIHAYFLVCDRRTTHQVAVAPTMRQAEEVMTPIATAITRARGPLFKFLTHGSLQNTTGNRMERKKLTTTKKGIESFLTNSLLEVRPMSRDKLQGLRTMVNTVDEWLSGDLREDVIGALEQGASKNPDWTIVAISSEGTVRNSVGDDVKMELLKILKGEWDNPHVSIWYYRLDDVKEVADPTLWVKAQPNIGQTVTYETYQQDVERAENNPSQRNDILAKRFGIPSEGYTYYFAYEETLPHRPREFWGLPCAMGLDLSQGDDFTAATFLFPRPDGTFGVKTRCYITEVTMNNLPVSLRIKFDEFLKEGTLIVMPETILDMMRVFDDLDEHILQMDYDVRAMGYDPYNAKEFVERWIAENGEYGVEKVIQGARTETVPLGEIKILAHERKLLFDQAIMQFCMGNTFTLEDTNGNRKLYKKRREAKIDSVSALMDAFVAYKRNTEAFE